MNIPTHSIGTWQGKLYVVLAIAGLVGTWAQVTGYLEAGFLAGNIAFWKDTVTTPAPPSSWWTCSCLLPHCS